MNLHVLPVRTAGAAENMALDFLLLQRYPDQTVPRFRHYGWRAPAFTFGFGQKIAYARAQLPPGEPPDLCRRPTGGGVVDHRDDWTYALILPRGHTLYDERAAISYRIDWAHRIAFPAYWIAPDFQGKGIMTQCLRFVIEHAFTELQVRQVVVAVATGNLRARALPEKLGFRPVSTLRKAEWLYDHHVDHIIYSLAPKAT